MLLNKSSIWGDTSDFHDGRHIGRWVWNLGRAHKVPGPFVLSIGLVTSAQPVSREREGWALLAPSSGGKGVGGDSWPGWALAFRRRKGSTAGALLGSDRNLPRPEEVPTLSYSWQRFPPTCGLTNIEDTESVCATIKSSILRARRWLQQQLFGHRSVKTARWPLSLEGWMHLRSTAVPVFVVWRTRIKLLQKLAVAIE